MHILFYSEKDNEAGPAEDMLTLESYLIKERNNAMNAELKIAVISNFTTDYIVKALCRETEGYQILCDIYHGPYNQYNQEILDEKSAFYAFDPELTIIILEGGILFQEWFHTETMFQSKIENDRQVDLVYEQIVNYIEKIHQYSHTKILFHNFVVPYYSPLGILESKSSCGPKRMITRLNDRLIEYAMEKRYLYIFDYNALHGYIGYTNARDKRMNYMTKNMLSFPFIKILVKEYMRYILPILSMNRKCLVVDLDNTLWGGVAGEDGLYGIRLDIDGPGRCYYDFQKAILNLYDRGIILAVCSKNNEEDAMPIIEKHPYMVLHKEHFAAIRINWKDKPSNIADIARELNIGMDSMVFFDDNPVERAMVNQMLPEVKTVDVPDDSSKYVQTLYEIVEFDRLELTKEDRKRNKMYASNQKRKKAEKSMASREDFLYSLETEMTVAFADSFTLNRAAQMTQKTNQFNMTTRRYDIEKLTGMQESQAFRVIHCTVADQFGDNGIVGLCIVKPDGNKAVIDTYLVSCRVLGRDIEYAFLCAVVDYFRNIGIKQMEAEFIETPKNKQNRAFYKQFGFSEVRTTDGTTLFSLDAGKPYRRIDHIKTITRFIESVPPEEQPGLGS